MTTTLEVDKTDDVTSTDSVNGKASVGTNIAGIVDASVKAAYGHTWSAGHGFAAKSTDPVPAHTDGEIDGIAPMIRDTGNFTITMGNTTYHLNDSTSTPPTRRAPRASSTTPIRSARRRSTPFRDGRDHASLIVGLAEVPRTTIRCAP